MNNSFLVVVIIPLWTAIIAAIGVLVTWKVNYVNRVSSNAWEVYKLYNSEEIKRARITIRTLMQDPDWQSVTDYASYRTYFQLDLPAGLGPGHELKKQQELDVHSLLAFYHQVGLLLEDKLLGEDFTVRLLGGGLADRWPSLALITQFYPDRPYDGMDVLYERYGTWKKRHGGNNALHRRQGAGVQTVAGRGFLRS